MILKAILWLLAVAFLFGQSLLQIKKLVQSIKADNENDIAFWGACLLLNLAVFIWFAIFILKTDKK